MTPDMSVTEMLDSFIYIVSGSKVIDRKDRRITDWGQAYWLPEKYVKHIVYSMSDLKKYFAHRVIKSKWKHEKRDPFNDWFAHPRRITAATLGDAMKFADAAARGLIEPYIDIDEMIRNEIAKLRSVIMERNRSKSPPQAWAVPDEPLTVLAKLVDEVEKEAAPHCEPVKTARDDEDEEPEGNYLLAVCTEWAA